jgi:hypothetical protein
MSKIIIWVVVLVVVVGGIVAATNNKETNTEENGADSSSEEFFGSAKDLIMSGKNVTCTFEREDENGSVNGTVYIKASDEKVRGDFTLVQPDGVEFKSSVINDGKMGYTWGSSPFGDIAVKFAINENDSSDTFDSDQPFEADEKLDYKCSSWSVDENKFNPPADVQFQDFTAGFNQIQSAETDICSACDQIPDANAQAQCRANLGCS